MKSAAKNIQLASYDDLFKTDEERQADTQERVQSLPLDKLEPFPNHPFKVIDDDKMLETVESINGVFWFPFWYARKMTAILKSYLDTAVITPASLRV